MKLDNREKYEKLRKFISQLKQKKNIDPFLDLDEIPKFGIYDFWYINKNPPSFTKIEKKIKDSKYDQLDEFLEDIRQIFVSVSDYAFSQDPIQKICEEFKEEVDRFRQTFLDEFKVVIIEPKIVKAPKPAPNPVKIKEKEPPVAPPPRQQPPPPVDDILFRERPSTLLEKLEMLFNLRANQNNEPYLRSIGTHYGIGM